LRLRVSGFVVAAWSASGRSLVFLPDVACSKREAFRVGEDVVE
jgi:hypothetical protein